MQYDKLAAQGLKQRGIVTRGHLNYLEINSEEGQSYLQVSVILDTPICTARTATRHGWCFFDNLI